MRVLLCLLLLVCPSWSHGLEKLPEWAKAHADGGLLAKPPAGADAWVLLQRIEYVYQGEGEYLRRTFRLVRVLTERGRGKGQFGVGGYSGKEGKVKKLLGWNLRPDGELVTLSADDVLTWAGDSEASVSTSQVTAATLNKVVPGSLIAFESTQRVRLPFGAASVMFPMEDQPVRRWELQASISPGWFNSAKDAKVRLDVRHFTPWIQAASVEADSIVARDLPAIPTKEPLHPHPFNALPMASVSFVDSATDTGPSLSSWNDYARWVEHTYRTKFRPIRPLKDAGSQPGGALAAILDWMNKELIYKQVYLTPERGWVPETSDEVLRKKYGDCKDLTSCFSGAASDAGFEPFPALARINEGRIELDPPVNPYLFNHVITAVRLKKSLGLSAEFETPRGRLLLLDPTSRLTPFGFLPEAHRGGRVMVCLPEGAQWVDIPDQAVEGQVLDFRLKGGVDAAGTFEGDLRVLESGDAAGLRAMATFQAKEGLKERLIHLLGLTPKSELKVVEVKHADQLEVPFELTLKIKVPQAWTRSAGEYSLRQTGFPGLPPAFPREGPPRRFPLESHAGLRWSLKLEVDLPFAVVPVCAQRAFETPFREVSWTSKLAGQHLSGTFVQVNRAVRYDQDRLDEGLRQARKDRSQLSELLEDATSFKAVH